MYVVAMFISLVTFPGVIVHEWAHKFFCDRAGVPVAKTRYFRLGNPAGYVVHAPATRYHHAVLIEIAPLLLNTLIALLIFCVAMFIRNMTAVYVLCWLGISVAMHAFPSGEDADNLWHDTRKALPKNPLAYICLPLVGLVKLAQLLRFIWFGLIYAVALFLLVAYFVRGSEFFDIVTQIQA
jgi:hypothetical protein